MSFWKRLWKRPEKPMTIRQMYLKMSSEQENHLMSLATYAERKQYIEQTFPIESFETMTDLRLVEEMFTSAILPVYDAHMSYESMFTMLQNYRDMANKASAEMSFGEKKAFLNSDEIQRRAMTQKFTGIDTAALMKVLVKQVTKDINRDLAKEQGESGGNIGFIAYYGDGGTSGSGDSSSGGGDAGGGGGDSGGF